MVSEKFAQQSFDSIALHSFADFFAHRCPKSWTATVILPLPDKKKET